MCFVRFFKELHFFLRKLQIHCPYSIIKVVFLCSSSNRCSNSFYIPTQVQKLHHEQSCLLWKDAPASTFNICVLKFCILHGFCLSLQSTIHIVKKEHSIFILYSVYTFNQQRLGWSMHRNRSFP